jgi:AcrR family transcriptional regulator
MAAPVTRLPRGRHGLSREKVVETQRARIFDAVAEVMMEKGFAATSVADIIRHAGVSRETFYEQFASKHDCFESAFERAADLLLGLLGQARPAGAPMEVLNQTFGTYLDLLAINPALSRLFLIEVYAAGPDVLQKRAAIQERFVDHVVSIVGAATPADQFACEVLVAGISSMVTAKLAANDVVGLRALRTPCMEFVRRIIG